MIIRIPKVRMSFALNYENIVVALAVVFFLETIYLITLHPALVTALKVIQFFLLGCVGVLFCKQRLTTKSMLVRLLVIAVFVMSLVFSGTFPLLKYGIVLLAGINCNISKLYSKLFKIYVFCIVMTVLLSIAGVLPSQIVRRGYSTYGFVHANTLALYLFSALCCFVILNDNRFKKKQWVISILIVIGTWYLTDSRTTLASMVFMAFLLGIVKLFPKSLQPGHVLYYIAILLPSLLMISSILLSWNYDMNHPMFSTIDRMLNGRLATAYNMVNVMNITLWGQQIVDAVESAYLTGLFQFGLLPMLIELVIYTYAVRKSILNRTYGIQVCLLAMALHGMAESATFSPFVNVALFSAFVKNATISLPQTEERGS